MFPTWSTSSSTTGGLTYNDAKLYWTAGSSPRTGKIGKTYEWRKVYKYGNTYFI
jgi:hypothetical protein